MVRFVSNKVINFSFLTLLVFGILDIKKIFNTPTSITSVCSIYSQVFKILIKRQACKIDKIFKSKYNQIACDWCYWPLTSSSNQLSFWILCTPTLLVCLTSKGEPCLSDEGMDTADICWVWGKPTNECRGKECTGAWCHQYVGGRLVLVEIEVEIVNRLRKDASFVCY